MLEDDKPDEGGEQHALTRISDIRPDSLLIVPVTDRPFLPAQAMPLVLDQEPWLSTFQQLYEENRQVVGVTLYRGDNPQLPDPEEFAPVGTLVRIHKIVREDDHIQFLAEGLRRFHIDRWLSRRVPLSARVSYPEEGDPDHDDETRAYAMAIISTLKELVPLNPLYSEELKHYLNRFSPNEPSPLCDFAASLTSAGRDELQKVLEAPTLLARMERVLVLLRKELEVAQLQASIQKQVEGQVSEQQRKFFLREQLKAIQRELGIAKDDREADIERFRERLAGRQLPKKASERLEEEMDKLRVLESGSPEYAVTRNWLDVITDLPWGQFSKDKLDLERARRVLDRDHAGLDDVKKRILEFLAVGALRGEISGSIVLLVGPPGVGKTSVGRSIAETLGRRFYRFSLGGMRDEAEIKGHRRTYIGAMPGKVIEALRESGTSNPVIMLDEVDKLGASFQGDPASALLEVLDPEQNSDFLDHYLDVRYDLSHVLFVCTANQLDTIPAPLLDRMEVIRLAGYITEEKVEIARRHLWPRLLQRSGLDRGQVRISKAALRQVIEGYAREAGVRNLEKQLAALLRKVAVEMVEGRQGPVRLGVNDIRHYLGSPRFEDDTRLERTPGVVTGLAWTAMGGATLNIEATRVHSGRRGFRLTGQLGEVMQESANIAYSHVSARLGEFSREAGWFDEAYIHLHVPEGATPKDGPSAGITMATALLGLALDRRMDRPLAMTGELTLTGKVLPVGGIREKVIAARRQRIPELILPETNRKDFEELPDYLREGLTVHFAKRFDDVVKCVFGLRPRRRPHR